jgi:hypothetical protein
MVRKYAVKACGRKEFAMAAETTSRPRKGVAAFKEKRKADFVRAARV